MKENEISGILLDIFIKIHKELGPGLLESVYEAAICHELIKREIHFKNQQAIPVFYDTIKLEIGFRADIVVENKVIIEIKSIEQIAPVHYKTLLTYLRLSKLKLGLLVNFNTNLLKDGFHRVVNNLEEE
jgi:GxxExxY protein